MSGQKSCRKCGETKPISEFYSRIGAKDGLRSHCKACCSAQVLSRRSERMDAYLESQRLYSLSESGKESSKRRAKKWARKNPVARRAHQKLNNELAAGRISKPRLCARCGTAGRIEGHHEDYRKPLDVVWVCPSCHKEIHGQKAQCLVNM